MTRATKVHIEDPKEHAKTLCGKVEKYLDKRKAGCLTEMSSWFGDITCQFCRNLYAHGSNRGDLR